MERSKKTVISGGEFLIRESQAQEIFIPEEFDEEAWMIRQTCEDFLETEVFPNLDRIDALEEGLMAQLLDKAGALGLLAVSVPEAYGGFGKDFNTGMLVADAIGAGHSFAVALSAHTGIGTLPILYYGNEAQKAKYLPKLASGEWKAAYCLTEPNAGSDANSGRTSARLNGEGTHYLINGQKMWITNGGFADVFIVFARIEDDKNLTAFIVERDFGGITMNPEERKMGIKGSSTRQLFFNDCPVPVENVLSERGNGFKIAVNILNVGRIKLAAAAIGSSRRIIGQAIRYANERIQFGMPIARFGAIRHKLAEMAARNFAVESAAYRAGQHIDDTYAALIAAGTEAESAKLQAVEQFAIECAILKVWASEMLDFVADEGVQIYGGMGYSAEAPMERAYRDSRINRIFEGTNEVNRLLIVDMLLKRARKGQLDLMRPAQAVAGELLAIPDMMPAGSESFSSERRTLVNLKKMLLLVAGAAVQRLGEALANEQELIMRLADIVGYLYLAESALLRAEKLQALRGTDAVRGQADMARIYLYTAGDQVYLSAKEAIHAFAEGDELRMLLMGLKRFTRTDPFNVKEARRRVAGQLIDANCWCY